MPLTTTEPQPTVPTPVVPTAVVPTPGAAASPVPCPELPAADDGVDAESWFTATVRPAGPLGHRQADRLGQVLVALAASASVVVLDLQAARLSSRHAAAVVDDAADRIERRGGCLLCVNADADSRATMAGCRHAVVMDAPAV
jgi:hypothetical protein